ncbi:unnamed protein product [Caenorhabditis auriculariae]|uniref:N(6)-L-threonylcarbamoyladenine synthase n=1 Tax=Caenorhabditis auriculariae TaxID=2777116 RepID=A0A8S1HDT9_9PELO|nr:unnamed protein product [Caenorhabditis auriculariae]
MGGISPGESAKQHRERLPELIEQCFKGASISRDQISAIAVTTRPGLVIALKEGIRSAIGLARELQKATHSRSSHASPRSFRVSFNGKSSISSPEEFSIYGQSVSGSPGECMDKIARELHVQQIPEFKNIHPGAAVEILASRSSQEGHSRYPIAMPNTVGADMNFSQIKSPYLNMARAEMLRSYFSLEDFAASLQHTVTKHIAGKVHSVLEWLKIEERPVKHLVISGGVGANRYISNGVSKVAAFYGVETVAVPPNLCTDNAEMIAYTGILMMERSSPDIIPWKKLPDMIFAHARQDIGPDERSRVPKRPVNRLAMKTVHGNEPVRFFDKEFFRAQAKIAE